VYTYVVVSSVPRPVIQLIICKKDFKMPRLFDLSFDHIADMHFVYGFCNGNAQTAVQEYRLRYPERPVLGYRSFMITDK